MHRSNLLAGSVVLGLVGALGALAWSRYRSVKQIAVMLTGVAWKADGLLKSKISASLELFNPTPDRFEIKGIAGRVMYKSGVLGTFLYDQPLVLLPKKSINITVSSNVNNLSVVSAVGAFFLKGVKPLVTVVGNLELSKGNVPFEFTMIMGDE